MPFRFEVCNRARLFPPDLLPALCLVTKEALAGPIRRNRDTTFRMVVRVNDEQSRPQDSQNDLAVLSCPIVGDEHLNALGSAAQLSILRDLCLEAGEEGHVTADEATQAALTYARLAASIGAAPEAMAAATLLMDRAQDAAAAGAVSAAEAFLQEAALRYYAAASIGDTDAQARLLGVLSHPLYREPTTAEVEQFFSINAMLRDGALGDRGALRAMAYGSIMNTDAMGLRCIVTAEQFTRLAASDGTRLSAMGLVAVLYLRASWEAQSGGSIAHGATAAAEAISIANAWALEGDQEARSRCGMMVEHLSPAMFALVAQQFPTALFYRNFEGVA